MPSLLVGRRDGAPGKGERRGREGGDRGLPIRGGEGRKGGEKGTEGKGMAWKGRRGQRRRGEGRKGCPVFLLSRPGNSIHLERTKRSRLKCICGHKMPTVYFRQNGSCKNKCR